VKIAVINFPGSNCDQDVVHVLRDTLGLETDLLWHREAHLEDYDAVILPGGFSYGDYLRAGVIAAYSPAVRELKSLAEKGRPILGICNGFQILVEAGLLPGALMKNINLKFVCKWINLRVETKRTAFTESCKKKSILRMPIAHNEGRYFIDPDELQRLYKNDQIVLTYVNDKGERTDESNPNGSLGGIAGICNPEGNILGLMPHPERASESILSPYRSEDGLLIFKSMVDHIRGS
jgi:phosphoribosylformylglycinamidine synthase I